MDTVELEAEVLEGYVEFEIEHCSEYIITKAVLESKVTFNYFMVIAIIEFIVIVGYILYIKLFNKKSVKSSKKKTA